MIELTEDSILNGKIKLFQPENGYRVAIDPIILANFVTLKAHHKVLDVGCGVGAISLILKMKENLSEVTALDIDEEMCQICMQNSAANALDLEVINMGIEENTFLEERLFDQVVTNPPFLEKKSSRTSESKKQANVETISLTEWIRRCLNKLKSNGIFSIIHRASRLEEILSALKNTAGAINITPIFPKYNWEANRIVVQAQKSNKSETKILPGVVVHRDDGNYSDYMCRVLSGNF
ncbi:MAG: methyltransferase [Holosporaceae bacterium]|jgi:tRNA1(Val) A37 N6-methylase TrmN6|nr:methyltransferase [Holosporaceae bacterium]